jgi:hypothetical protein
MSSTLPKGFKLLPVTTWCVIGLITIPLVVSVLNCKPYFMFAWDPFITKWNQYWRLLILQLQFQNQSAVAISVVLLALKLKGIERVFGSLKLFKDLILLFIYNLFILTIVSFLMFNTIGWDMFIPAGPFGVIFSLYYPFNKYIPEVYVAEFDFSTLADFQPFGERMSLSITDKFSGQLLYLLLMFNEGFPSLVISVLGYFVGYLYFNDLVPFSETSLKFLDPLYYKLTHEKSHVNARNDELPGNERIHGHSLGDMSELTTEEGASNPLDLADEEDDDRAGSREDTPVRTFGERITRVFRGRS